MAIYVSTSTASGDRELHDIYYDGISHFFIDGVDSYPNGTRDDDRIISILELSQLVLVVERNCVR